MHARIKILAGIKIIAAWQVKFISAVLMCITLGLPAYAAIETHSFDNDVERKRYQSFIEEMRCPKCQNQNLAGSDSLVSIDLRNEIYALIKAGKGDQEIVDFMVTRYGEFILYRPRVTPVTYLLWAAPAVLLILGTVLLLVMLRQRRQLALTQSATNLTAEEQTRLSALLEGSLNVDQTEPTANDPKSTDGKIKINKSKKNNSKNNQEQH